MSRNPSDPLGLIETNPPPFDPSFTEQVGVAATTVELDKKVDTLDLTVRDAYHAFETLWRDTWIEREATKASIHRLVERLEQQNIMLRRMARTRMALTAHKTICSKKKGDMDMLAEKAEDCNPGCCEQAPG